MNGEFDDLVVDIGRSPLTPVLERTAILVAGSHRSGTSALARVLSLLGCDLPKHVLAPAEDNELGFWEPVRVLQAHDVFLGSMGSSWDDVAAIPDGAFVSAAARELRQELALLLHEEYGSSSLFVVKDPRIARLLPVWLAVLAELQAAPAIALVVRNPLEVAASLRARNGFTTTKSLLLWLRHTIEYEQHSRGRARSVVLYDELLRNWHGVVARVGEDLGITWPGSSHRATVEIEHFLSERQRHHVFDWRDLEGRSDVVSWVKEAYFALRGTDPVQVLDQVRDELARADKAFGPILEEARLELDASREQTLQGAAARDALGRDIEARSLELEAREVEVQQLREEVGEMTSSLAAVASQAATHEADVAALHAERDRLAHEVERFGEEARQLAAAVEAAQARVDAADAETARTREELNTAQAEVDRLRNSADEAVARAAALEANASAERETLLSGLHTARATVEQLEERIAGANAALGALEAQAASDRGALLQELTEARAEAERLTARIVAEELEAAAARRKALADLDAANAEANRLAKQLEDTSFAADELASTADELLSSVEAELEASQAAQDRLRAEIVDNLEENGELRILVEHLEGALESTAAALREHEQAAAAAGRESAARQAEVDNERTRLRHELETARTNFENARAEVEFAHNELQMLRSEAASEREALSAEHGVVRAEADGLVAELESARAHADGLAARTAELEAALGAHTALLHRLQSVSGRRTSRWRTLSQLGTWLLPPTPRKLNYLRQYLALRGSGEFDVDAYLLGNHDVLTSGINPLMHYVEYGRREGRMVHVKVHQPDRAMASISPDSSLQARDEPMPTHDDVVADSAQHSESAWLSENQRDLLAAHFDADYYLATYPDITAAGVDPLDHYSAVGWREGRDPSPRFSSSYYLDAYPDVREAGMQPLLHYVIAGLGEGRRSVPPEVISTAELPPRSLEEEIGEWLCPTGNPGLTPNAADLGDTTLEQDDAEIVKQVLAWRGRAESVRMAEQLAYRPLISILIPTFNTPTEVLSDTVKSILSQSYSQWELIVVDDGSTSQALTAFLSGLIAWDNRISVTHLPTNSGISAATNKALHLARGEYIALVDHDDLVLPDALLAVVRVMNDDSAVDVIYTDQEYGDQDGVPQEPLVKPDWDPYLFLGVMYVGHLLVVRRTLATTVGGFDSNFDNVQDFEFMLRLSEHTDRIRHVPAIHYRWRRVPGSVAAQGDAKADIESLQSAAVSAHLRRRGVAASVRPHPYLAHRALLAPSPAKPPSLSLILGPIDDANAVASTFQTYLTNLPTPLDVWCWGVDAAAAVGSTPAQPIAMKPAHCLADAAESALGDMLLFLEPGLLPASEEWPEHLQFYARLDKVACASGVVVDSAGLIDEAGLVIGIDGAVGAAFIGRNADSDGYAGSLSCTRAVAAVSGRNVMISRALLLSLGGMNRHYSETKLAWVDLSFRAAQRGLHCVVSPQARFVREATNRQVAATTSLDLLLLRDRWGRRLDAGDPYHIGRLFDQ